jgi:hypothetical protein
MKAMVDNAALQMNPQMCVNTLPPPPPMPITQSRTEDLAHDLLPKVCCKHVYRFDHVLHDTPERLASVVTAKWTFFNDQSVMLKADVEVDDATGKANLVPIDEDFDMEEWKATAIMVCDAGEEVWQRPKPQPISGGLGGPLSAAQANQMQQAGSQQMQSALAGQSGSFEQGLLQGFNPNIFGRFFKQ